MCRARNSKRKKSWNAPASRARHSSAGMRASGVVVDEDRARRRLVHLRQQLDQRRLAGAVLADDRDDRAGRQRQRHVVEHDARSVPGIRERHVLEADAVAQRGRAPADRPSRRATRRSPRATPAAASRPSRCRAGSRSRRPSRRCTPTAARRRRAPAARRRPTRRGRTTTNTTAPTYAGAEDRPRQRVPRGRAPARRGDRPVPALPRLAALARPAARRCR